MAEVLERRLTDATSKAEAKKTLGEMFIAERSSFQTAKEDEIEAFLHLHAHAAPSEYRTSIRSKNTAVSSASKAPSTFMRFDGEANKRRKKELAEP